MKSMPCFLALLSFLLAITPACTHQTNSTQPPAKSPSLSSLKPSAPDVAVGSEYESLVLNGSIARYMRGEPSEPVFSCQATGDFNLAPIPNFIVMETWCINELALQEGEIEGFQVEDQLAMRLDGDTRNFYVIPFDQSVIEVKPAGNEPAVFLHYKDEAGEYHHVSLAKRSGKDYDYSFAKYVPKRVIPDTHERRLGASQ
jgi:hypothetical protein